MNNHVYIKLYLEKEIVYLPNDQSIFLIEELSNRSDFQVISKRKDEIFF